jgi:hypothetical protein
MNDVVNKAPVMLIEFAGGFVSTDTNKLFNDTIKIYRNAARLLNSTNSDSKHPPCMFVVLSHRFKVYFEWLSLVTDRAYVCTRMATLDVPYSPGGLKAAMQQFPGVFSWRNAVINYVKNTAPFNNANLETIPVP